MTNHFNKLTEAEQELISILSEECGEVVQIIGKILRHGYDSFNPFDKKKTTNRELLSKEIAHIKYIVKRMIDSKDIDNKKIIKYIEAKGQKIEKYLHHQEDVYSIGKVKSIGFGVAAIKDEKVPKGWSKLEGHDNPAHKNYGNILDNNGSIMIWIAKFYFRWTKKNKCKISAVKKDGYALHRAFIDGGIEQDGFFVDKYECGNVDSKFTSKEDLEPCNTYGNNSISHLSNNPNSDLGGLYKAIKTRGDKHFLTTIFIWNALGMLAYANNGDKLEQMKFHNNQECGVKNINPLRYEVAAGLIKLNDRDGIFKVLKHNIAAKELLNDGVAYSEEFYNDLNLTKFIGDGGWKYASNKVQTFAMSEDIYSKDYIKTCMGLPRTKALSDDSNEKLAMAGVYRYARNEMACLVGGRWGDSSYAGVFAMYLSDSRTSSYDSVGGRTSIYLS